MRHPPPGGDLVAPELPLVALGEAADHDGDGQREDEDAGQRAAAADDLAQQRLGVQIVADRGEGHQAPPAPGEPNHILINC